MNTKTLKSITAAVSLLVAAPTVGAVTVNEVDILDGFVDVQENGAIGINDDLNNVILWCDEAMPVRVDIIDGEVDVNEDGVADTSDDLFNCDLNDENNGIPSRNQVDIRDGTVDVDEDTILNEVLNDDIQNVQLFVLP